MKRLRSRLTYANVISTICLFLVLGSGAAFAATKLAKNSVGTKQLKNNAVTTAKIKNAAVSTAKVKNGAITGAKIDLGSLGTVPSAANAEATGGIHLAKIHYRSGQDGAATTVFSGAGLTLTAQCTGSQLEFTGTTSVARAEIYESGNYEGTYYGAYSEGFNPGETEFIGKNIADGSQDEVQGQLVYSTPAGAVVTAQFTLNDVTIEGDSASGCAVEGIAEYSG